MATTKTTKTETANKTALTEREAVVLAWVRATDALRALEIAGREAGLESCELETIRECVESLDIDRPRLV